MFSPAELELLISGLPEIKVEDLKAHTDYVRYSATSPQIVWFWNVVGRMDDADLAGLVMFFSGTSRVPLEGFKAIQGMRGTQHFNIHRAGRNDRDLPAAHTCFNQLDLPEYSNEKTLEEKLLLAIREGSQGFAMA